MDTTRDDTRALERVDDLLASVPDGDPADAVEPLSEVADLLETLLDGGDER